MRGDDSAHEFWFLTVQVGDLDEDLANAASNSISSAERCHSLLSDVHGGRGCAEWSLSPDEYQEAMDRYYQFGPIRHLISAATTKVQTVGLASAASTCEAAVRYHCDVLRAAMDAAIPGLSSGFDYGYMLPEDVLHEQMDFAGVGDQVVSILLKFRLFDLQRVAARIDKEVFAAWRLRRSLGLKSKLGKPTLSAVQQRVLDHIKANPNQVGKEIAKALDISQSTLTRHLIPALKKHGVINFPGSGYRLSE